MTKRHIGNDWWTVFACCLFVFYANSIMAQISPGDLTSAHAHLEGIANCTKCHVLGDKVTNAKCLDCHKEIKSRIDFNKGYHASSEVKGKDCFACHSEHHGRSFEIVRFDEDRFNHNLTGYPLTGAHMSQDCKACHNDEHITNEELRKKKQTYLGLSTECISCHQDVHQGTLTTNCASCHNTAVFQPAALFDHSKTSFPLKGRHRTVDCRSCHEVETRNGQEFQRFAGVPFNSCADCHNDVHDNRFGRNCKECHNEESFFSFSGKSAFNHNQTEFPLLGKHRQLDCAACHKTGDQVTAENVFKDYSGKNFHQCQTCHKDPHENKFGQDCKSCHSEESFFKIRNIDKFDHSLTSFELVGRHQQVDCRKCHENRLTDPVPHARCADCHEDFHDGQFVSQNNLIRDCAECHTEHGFEGSTYTIEQHNTTDFPLTGSHLATPCFSCHLKKEEWTFRDIGTKCNDCHIDIHEGYLDTKYYPDKTCTACHTPEGWTEVTFDHTQTEFPLEGRHEIISCTACHQPDTISGQEIPVPFTGLNVTCVSCHENVHGDQFMAEGTTDCTRCHSYDAWQPSLFDHNNARFKLDGAHQQVDCAGCHKPDTDPDGVIRIQYRTGKLECVDCHL